MKYKPFSGNKCEQRITITFCSNYLITCIYRRKLRQVMVTYSNWFTVAKIQLCSINLVHCCNWCPPPATMEGGEKGNGNLAQQTICKKFFARFPGAEISDTLILVHTVHQPSIGNAFPGLWCAPGFLQSVFWSLLIQVKRHVDE